MRDEEFDRYADSFYNVAAELCKINIDSDPEIKELAEFNKIEACFYSPEEFEQNVNNYLKVIKKGKSKEETNTLKDGPGSSGNPRHSGKSEKKKGSKGRKPPGETVRKRGKKT